MGCYLSPNKTLTIESVVAALKEHPRGAELFVEGGFNINLLDPDSDWREMILRQIWQQRDLIICWRTSFCAGSYGSGMGKYGSLSERGGR